MTGNTAEWLQAIVAFLALLAATAAWFSARRAYLSSYRPIIRVVPTFDGKLLKLNELILKNLGRGPAISVVVIRDRGSDEGDLITEEVISAS